MILSIITLVKNIEISKRKLSFLKMMISIKNNINNFDSLKIEHNIIDTCSIDNTELLIQKFKDKYQINYDLNYFSDKDFGIFDGINNAVFNYSKGKYLIFINSDDEINKKNLRIFLQNSSLNKDIYFFSTFLIGTNTKTLFKPRINTDKFIFENVFNHQSSIIKKEIYESLPFNTVYNYTIFPWNFELIRRIKLKKNQKYSYEILTNNILCKYSIFGHSNSKKTIEDKKLFYNKEQKKYFKVPYKKFIEISIFKFNNSKKSNFKKIIFYIKNFRYLLNYSNKIRHVINKLN